MTRKTAPLNKFVRWEENPRQLDEAHVQRLMTSIGTTDKDEINLLQNLIAVPHKGKLVAIAGGHRLESLQRLAKLGQVSKTVEIPYDEKNIDLNNHEAINIALQENTLRLQMSAVDEAIAYFRMAQAGKKVADIVIESTLSESTVRQRIAIGGLPADALGLIRKGERTLAWGMALTAADVATRTRIMSDIQSSPTTWKDEQDIRKFLYKDTIPASHALFAESAYLGPILRDMFEGTRFQDRSEFWEHQNVAIEAKKVEYQNAGWGKVVISHQPIDTWKYGTTDVKADATVIIEVAPNGKVTFHEGLVDHAFDSPSKDGVIEALDDGDTGEPSETRLSSGILEFGRTVKSAVLRAEVSTSPRKAKEIIVAGLLGSAESPFRMLSPRLKGDARLRHGAAFDKMAENQREIAQAVQETGGTAGIQGFVAGLDDGALDTLMARLVADRLVMPTDAAEGGLMAAIGISAGSIRQHWRPTEAFLNALPAPELRHIALTLLPSERQRGVVSARKNQLVPLLVTLFDEAAANAPTLDRDTAEQVNSWAPAWMSFQATEVGGSHDEFLSAFADEEQAEAA